MNIVIYTCKILMRDGDRYSANFYKSASLHHINKAQTYLSI